MTYQNENAAAGPGEPRRGIYADQKYHESGQQSTFDFDFNNAPPQQDDGINYSDSSEWTSERIRQAAEEREREEKEKYAQDDPAPSLNIFDWQAHEVFTGEPKKREYFIHGVFPKGQVSLLAAAGGVGKSMLLLEAMRFGALNSGGNLLNILLFGGRLVGAGPTVYISAEDDQIEIHSRLNDMGGAVPGLIAVPLPSAGGAPILFKSDPSGPVATEHWWALSKQIQAVEGLAAVAIDPLQVFCSLDLNMPENAQFVCSHLSRLASETGAAIIISHHFRKGAVSGVESAREAIRGTAGLVDGVRAVYALWMPQTGTGKESPQSICKALRVPYVPGIVVHGAVVKANGRASNHVSTFVRDQKTGLLIDRTDDLRGFFGENLPALLVDAISAAALCGKPYTRTGLSGLYTRRHELPKSFHAVSKHRLQEMADELLQSNQVVLAMAEGSKIVKWLDVPDGPFAKGEGVFEHGS